METTKTSAEAKSSLLSKILKPRGIAALVIALAVIAGGVYYYGSQAQAEDAPPSLEAATSNTTMYQGLTKGGKYMFAMWEEADVKEFNRMQEQALIAGISPVTIDEGVNYLYAPATITYGDVFKMISPDAKELVVSQYDPELDKFLIYPKTTYYKADQTIEVKLDQEIKKGEGFMVVADSPSIGYWLHRGDTTSNLDQEDIAQMVELLNPEILDTVKTVKPESVTTAKITEDLTSAKVKTVTAKTGMFNVSQLANFTGNTMTTDLVSVSGACTLPEGWNLIVVEKDINHSLGGCFDKVEVLWTQINKVKNDDDKWEEKFEKIFRRGDDKLTEKKVAAYTMTHKMAWVRFGKVAPEDPKKDPVTEDPKKDPVTPDPKEGSVCTPTNGEEKGFIMFDGKCYAPGETVPETDCLVTEEGLCAPIGGATPEDPVTPDPKTSQIVTNLKVVDDKDNSDKVIISWDAPEKCGDGVECEYMIIKHLSVANEKVTSSEKKVSHSLDKPIKETTYRVHTNKSEEYAEVTYKLPVTVTPPVEAPQIVTSLKVVDDMVDSNKVIMSWKAPEKCGDGAECLYQVKNVTSGKVVKIKSADNLVTKTLDKPTNETTYTVQVFGNKEYTEVKYSPAPFDLTIKSLEITEGGVKKIIGAKSALPTANKGNPSASITNKYIKVGLPTGCGEATCAVQFYKKSDKDNIIDATPLLGMTSSENTILVDISDTDKETTFNFRVLYTPPHLLHMVDKKKANPIKTKKEPTVYVGPFREITYYPPVQSVGNVEIEAKTDLAKDGTAKKVEHNGAVSTDDMEREIMLEVQEFKNRKQIIEMAEKLEEMAHEAATAPHPPIDPVGPVSDGMTDETTQTAQTEHTSQTAQTEQTSQTSQTTKTSAVEVTGSAAVEYDMTGTETTEGLTTEELGGAAEGGYSSNELVDAEGLSDSTKSEAADAVGAKVIESAAASKKAAGAAAVAIPYY